MLVAPSVSYDDTNSYSHPHGGTDVKTVQMTLEPELLRAVDRAARQAGTSRSGFTRSALREALARLEERELERRHREGYARQPVHAGEFDAWSSEQEWGD